MALSELAGAMVAFGSSSVSLTGVSLQAREAALSRRDLGLRPRLLVELARRPRWMAGIALKLASWPLQAVALLLAPLTLVRPAFASGLVVLVAIGHRADGSRVSRGEVASVAAIVAGVAGIAAGAPARTEIHAGSGRLAVAMGGLAVLALAPFALRLFRRPSPFAIAAAAGLAAAWTGLATKLATDDLARGDWLGVVGWSMGIGAAALVGLLGESTALQTLRPTQVVPLMLVVQIAVPVALAPSLTGESWTAAPAGAVPLAVAMCMVAAGCVALARRPEVAAAAAGVPDGGVDAPSRVANMPTERPGS